MPEDWCNGNIALTGDMFTGPATTTMTLCKDNFFKDNEEILEVLTADGVVEGSRLQRYLPRAMTFVHEIVHATQGHAGTYERFDKYGEASETRLTSIL
jgi:hypothetical protein